MNLQWEEADESDIDGTRMVGELSATTFDTLLGVFGEPLHGDGSKTDAEWWIRTSAGPATIYNWKNGPAYGIDTRVHDITEWHIGGESDAVVPIVKALVGDPFEDHMTGVMVSRLSYTVDEYPYQGRQFTIKEPCRVEFFALSHARAMIGTEFPGWSQAAVHRLLDGEKTRDGLMEQLHRLQRRQFAGNDIGDEAEELLDFYDIEEELND